MGIAEEHAVTMCAGLAAGGMRPYFFVYSTFLQRGIQNLPVVLMIDRAGISNEDGQSHQGLYDYAYLRHIPRMNILAPADLNELEFMLKDSLNWNGPYSIRYPKSAECLPDGYRIDSFRPGTWLTLRQGEDAVILAAGTMTAASLRAADQMQQEGIAVEVINASSIKPMDTAVLKRVCTGNVPVFTIEEHVLMGGFGSAVLEWAAQNEINCRIVPIAVKDEFIQHGDHKHLLEEVGLDDASIMSVIRKNLNKQKG